MHNFYRTQKILPLLYLKKLPKVKKPRSVNVDKIRPIWGRCYDHNFLRVFPIFGEKIGVLSNTNVMTTILHNLALFRVKSANFFAEIFGENI
jgi:hypothetical protein